MNDKERIDKFRDSFAQLKLQIGKVIVGQTQVVEHLLVALFAGGHVLMEGIPGLGKTKTVNTMAKVLDLAFSRIQFTPDLMPADIVGTNIIVEDEQGKHFEFRPGPLFAQIILADEINRATPKTQSALLEAMQEGSITSGGGTHRLKQPFWVLATQNPIEMEGTYPLPEAQLDRFMMKLVVQYPDEDELIAILNRTTKDSEPEADRVLDAKSVLEFRSLARRAPIATHVMQFAASLVLLTHAKHPATPDDVKRYVQYGSSPRGAQGLVLAGKVRALTQGRYNVSVNDIAWAALPILRHRMLLNFEGEAKNIKTDEIIPEVVSQANQLIKQVSS